MRSLKWLGSLSHQALGCTWCEADWAAPMLNKQRSQLRTAYELRIMAARTGTIHPKQTACCLKKAIWSCVCYSDQSDVFKQRLYSLICTHTHIYICIYIKESLIGCIQMSIPPTPCSFFWTYYAFYYCCHALLYPRLKTAHVWGSFLLIVKSIPLAG